VLTWQLFTLGSAVWTVNGFFVFLPSLNVMGDNDYVLGWTAFVGGTIFELGSYFMVLESLNRQQVVCHLFSSRANRRCASVMRCMDCIHSALMVSTSIRMTRSMIQRPSPGSGLGLDSVKLGSLQVQFKCLPLPSSGLLPSLASLALST
jgi:hypothetical protein